MLQGKKQRKIIAATFLAIMLTNLLVPTVSYALTNGPTSPEATSFEPIDTTDMVSRLTGDFTYNVPLLEVPGPEGGYPLSLSYHAGIQPNEDASWVGLGWSLNTGAVNRYVSGYPDDWEDVKETRRDYWSGGSSLSVGIVYASSTVSFGLNFSTDTYRGFDVGVSGGSNGMTLEMDTYSGGSMEITAPIANEQDTKNGTSISSSFGLTTNFQSISVSTSTQFSYKGLGISTSSNGGIQYGAMAGRGKAMGSILNSKLGKISTSGFSFAAGFPAGDGYIGLSFSKRRYWSDETSVEPVNGSLYLNGKPVNHLAFNDIDGLPYADQYGFDTYFLQNNFEANILDKPDPGTLQGGAYIDFDAYDVAAQGLGGTFRPYIFQGNVVSEYRGGDDGPRHKVKWLLPGLATVVPHTNPQFRFVGDFSNKFTQDVESDYSDRNNIMFGASPFDANPKFGDNQFSGYDASKKKLEGSRHIDYFTNQNILDGVAKQSGFIAPVNALGFTRNTQNSYYSYTAVNDNGNRNDVNITDNSLGKQIGGFSITNENGVTYHFGLPAYAMAEQVYTERIEKFNNGSVWNNLTKGKSYAYTWYLTTITGADFVDKNGNGIADKDDYGYWVNFEYGKWTDSYNWRNPSQGFHRDIDNEYQSYSKGKKQIYYLNAVSTRSHTAIFEKDYRKDARGISDDAFVVWNNHSTEYPGGFSSTSKGSLNLSHIYIFNNENLPYYSPSDGSALTTNPAEFQNNVIDNYDIAPKSSVENLALRVLDFNYDYSLAERTPNHLGDNNTGSGKLTLKSIFFRGLNGTNQLPPLRFYYELDPTQQVTGNITCTNFTMGNPVFEFTSAASFAMGDILSVTSSQSYQCVILSYNAANNTYKAKEIVGRNDSRPPRGVDYSGAAVTTKNPWYDKDAYDLWGMYKPDYDPTVIDQNENLGRATNKVSAISTDAWSLRRIRTMMGDDILINYEPDSYSKSEVNGMASLIMNRDNIQSSTLPNGSTNVTFQLHLPAGNSIKDFFQEGDVLEMQLLQYASASPTFNSSYVNQVVIKKDELTIESAGNTLYTSSFNAATYKPLTVTTIDEVNGLVTANTTIPFQTAVTDMSPGYIYFNYKGGNVLNNNNRMTYGGGIRVKSLGIGHLVDNSVSFTHYDYNIPGKQTSSGVTPYEPGVFDNCDIYTVSDRASFKRTLYSRANDLLNLARELPSPGIMYQYVTIGRTLKKSGEVERIIEGKTTYEYEVFNNNMVWRDFIGGGTGADAGFNNMPTQTNILSIKKSLNRLGNIRHITSYDDRGKKLSEIEYHYLYDGLETADPETFYTQYKQRLIKYQNQGLINERYLELKSAGSGHDHNFTEKATLSGREDFPSVPMGETHYDYISGTQSSSKNLAFDFFSGAVTKTQSKDVYGNIFVSEAIPAYRKYGGMGMKISDASNKNMLTAVTGFSVYKYENETDPDPIGLVQAQVQTWSNQIPVLDPADNIITQNNTGGNGNVWRQQAAYVWQPAGSTSDGLTPKNSFTAFNWASMPASSSNWKKNGEATLYDVYSHNLEVKDFNGTYAATKMDWRKQRVIVAGSASNYYELAYGSAEGRELQPQGANDVKYVDGTVSGMAHTGSYGLSLSAGGKRAFVYTVSTDNLVAGRNYAAKVWAHPETSNTDVKLYYKINGVEKGVAAYTASSQNAGVWRLLHLTIKGSDIVPGATLEVGCRNDIGTQGLQSDIILTGSQTGLFQAYNSITLDLGFESIPPFTAEIVSGNSVTGDVTLDDFRFQPLNASSTAYVYDDFTGELTYMLNNNNLFEQYEYDATGRLVGTYNEKMGVGKIKSSEYVYNNACQSWVFTNKQIYDEYFWRRDCSGTAKPVKVTVPAGSYGSCISQQRADEQATNFAQSEASRLSVCGPRVYVYMHTVSTNSSTSCEVVTRTTYTLHFYSDPQGINPVSVSDFPVLLKWSTRVNNSIPNTTDSWITCNGTTTVVAADIPTYSASSCIGWIVVSGYTFRDVPSLWYTILNSGIHL
jgi:hypothetical protein